MAQPSYTSVRWQRGVRSDIVVSIATIPPFLWLLRRHLDADSKSDALGLRRRNQQ
jgi:hypothetical protein